MTVVPDFIGTTLVDALKELLWTWVQIPPPPPMNLLDFLFPKKCVGCGRLGDYVCKDCQVGIWEPEPAPVPQNLDGLICLWAYDGLMQKIIKKAKYSGLYNLLQFTISKSQIPNKSQFPNLQAIIPVPLYRDRLRERGFNQAEIIAKEISKIYKIPVVNLLVRTKDTGHQTLRNREERLKAIDGAFEVSTKIQDLPSKILLVDDVMTTGATLSECARTLKKAGVNKVYGLVLAR